MPTTLTPIYLLSTLCLKQQRLQETRHDNYSEIIAEPEDEKANIVRSQALYETGRAIIQYWKIDRATNSLIAAADTATIRTTRDGS